MKQCYRLARHLVLMMAVAAPASYQFAEPVEPPVQVKATESARPTVRIIRVPRSGGGPDAMETISGSVSGVDVTRARIVLLSRTNVWWVQPYAASPFTSISEDGSFSAPIHLGIEYAAIVVTGSYTPPATTDVLPRVGGNILAIATVAAEDSPRSSPGRKTGSESGEFARTLRFSGYEWKVKSSAARIGPGPNYFSDRSENVEVDRHGRLHLRLTKQDGEWHCPEIKSARSFGYGTYQFTVDGMVDKMDPQLVLGLFTWSDAPAFSHREIDVEIARWGEVGNDNAQFVVQPYTNKLNIVRFEIPRGLHATTHAFTWAPGQVSCRTSSGSWVTIPNAKSLIKAHTFTRDIPQAGDESVHINLWLLGGLPPSDLKEAEIVISRFEVVPLRRGPTRRGIKPPRKKSNS